MKRKPDKNSKFAERLRGLRRERCLSSRYEQGTQEPMLSTVAALADFFHVSPVYLIGDSNDRSCTASNIQNSAVVQGNHATTLIVRNGGVHERELDESEVELLRILDFLDVKDGPPSCLTPSSLKKNRSNARRIKMPKNRKTAPEGGSLSEAVKNRDAGRGPFCALWGAL